MQIEKREKLRESARRRVEKDRRWGVAYMGQRWLIEQRASVRMMDERS